MLYYHYINYYLL